MLAYVYGERAAACVDGRAPGFCAAYGRPADPKGKRLILQQPACLQWNMQSARTRNAALAPSSVLTPRTAGQTAAPNGASTRSTAPVRRPVCCLGVSTRRNSGLRPSITSDTRRGLLPASCQRRHVLPQHGASPPSSRGRRSTSNSHARWLLLGVGHPAARGLLTSHRRRHAPPCRGTRRVIPREDQPIGRWERQQEWLLPVPRFDRFGSRRVFRVCFPDWLSAVSALGVLTIAPHRSVR